MVQRQGKLGSVGRFSLTRLLSLLSGSLGAQFASGNQVGTLLHPRGIVKVQQARRCTPCRRTRGYRSVGVKPKVIIPSLRTGVEESHIFSCTWIERSVVGAFVMVTVKARVGEVLCLPCAPVLPSNNMIDFVGSPRSFCRQLTVLTPSLSSFNHSGA